MRLSNGYEVSIAKSIDEIEAIRLMWEELQSSEPRPVINADIDRYLSVVRAIGDKAQPYIMLVKKDGCPVAMAICLFHKEWPLKLTFGYKAFFSPTVRCLEVVYGGAIGCLNDDISETLVRELMKVLRRNEADIVRFNHVKTDSCVFKSSQQIPGILTRGHFQRKECHWSMLIPENIDLFYETLSKKHRGNIKRSANKLYNKFAGQVNIVTYTEEDELDGAIKTASQISRSTYQYGLGSGFVDNSWTRELLTTAARYGWLRMSVLFVNQQPCAFQIGLRYGEQYMLDQIGFDPKWGRYEVGTILFVKVLEDIWIYLNVLLLKISMVLRIWKAWEDIWI